MLEGKCHPSVRPSIASELCLPVTFPLGHSLPVNCPVVLLPSVLVPRSSSLRDQSSGGGGGSSEGLHGHVHLSGHRRADAHHHLEAELGAHPRQRQVGPFTADALLRNYQLRFANSSSDTSGYTDDNGVHRLLGPFYIILLAFAHFLSTYEMKIAEQKKVFLPHF